MAKSGALFGKRGRDVALAKECERYDHAHQCTSRAAPTMIARDSDEGPASVEGLPGSCASSATAAHRDGMCTNPRDGMSTNPQHRATNRARRKITDRLRRVLSIPVRTILVLAALLDIAGHIHDLLQ